MIAKDTQRKKRKDIVKLLISMQEDQSMDERGLLANAKQLAIMLKFDGPLGPIIKEVVEKVDIRMAEGQSLIDNEIEHDEKWPENNSKINWTYSNCYKEYLRDEKTWSDSMIQDLDRESVKILSLLVDPEEKKHNQRTGLVIGHVQSGKTANYVSLITKAADAGYRLIVVLAGLENNLRKQTQIRIDEGFVGRQIIPDTGGRRNVGVGIDRADYPYPVSLTSIQDDFSKKIAEKVTLSLDSLATPMVLVIKKNVKILNALHRWLDSLNLQEHNKIFAHPMLMIDDEADYASINTHKEEDDPTKTNIWLRKILNLFGQACYVGYTATPFANIFIDPTAMHDDMSDLFPKHFIHSLQPPSNYFGPEKVFPSEGHESSEFSELIQEIPTSVSSYLPLKHKKTQKVSGLPPSLLLAVRQFIIARALRNLSGASDQHCSMLVNVSVFTNVQTQIRTYLEVYIGKLRRSVQANYKMPQEHALKDLHIRELKETYKGFEPNTEKKWGDVQSELFACFQNLKVYLLNAHSNDVLNYELYNGEFGLAAIAVGGIKLSRGLTLEGLCVSYMYRNTKMYDTLMQMGRWFGFHTEYEKLCRIHLLEDSINWYSYISLATEELRAQIGEMIRAGLTPKDFGLCVRDHPTSLTITALGKMRTGVKLERSINLNGSSTESFILPQDQSINEANLDLFARYWPKGFSKDMEVIESSSNPKRFYLLKDVETSKVINFLDSFSCHQRFEEKKNLAIEYFNKIMNEYQVSDVALISSTRKCATTVNIGDYSVKERIRSAILREEGFWLVNKYRLGSPSDERIGLDLSNDKTQTINTKTSMYRHYRKKRGKPFLQLSVNCMYSKAIDIEQHRIPGFGISFPVSNSSIATKSVMANLPYMENEAIIYSFSKDENEIEE